MKIYSKRKLLNYQKLHFNFILAKLESFIAIQEPTSGLDSHSAQALISRLKKYAEQEGKSIVVTVHQPSSRMFHSFSKLLLLSRGQVAYYGSTSNIARFFSTIGLTLLPHYNPADFIRKCILSNLILKFYLWIIYLWQIDCLASSFFCRIKLTIF